MEFVLYTVAILAGAGLSWILLKGRTGAALSQLKANLLNAEEKLRYAERQLQVLNEQIGDGRDLQLKLEKENMRFSTELSLAHTSIANTKEEAGIAAERLQQVQSELARVMQEKAVLQTELAAANAWLIKLQDTEVQLRNETSRVHEQLNKLRDEHTSITAQFREKENRLQQQEVFINEANARLKEAFTALSAEALSSNNNSFVTLAKQTLEGQLQQAKGDLDKKEEAIKGIVAPLNESLKTIDQKIHDLEGKRIRAYSDIWNYLDQVKTTTEGLRKETTNLVGALKTSHSRGRYGEIALRRLVEYAGMVEHCHFSEQVSVEDENGKLRPDMVINLPGAKKLVVDSKVPLSAYLRVFETDDPEQQRVYASHHVLAVKDHLKKLSAKSYWQQFDEAPDFVIMYMHIESSFGSALQTNADLIEEAFRNRIIIATPTILISILMSVGYSWNQIKTMENIEEIRSAAVELFERSTVLVNHMVSLGGSIDNTVKHYNNTIGSLEGNFMPQARKINALSQAYTKKTLKEPEPVDTTVRPVMLTASDRTLPEKLNEPLFVMKGQNDIVTEKDVFSEEPN